MTIHLTRTIDSEQLNLPELKSFIGKHVSITIQETPTEENRWKELAAIGGRDLIDPEVVRRYREFDAAQMEAQLNDPR